MSVIKSQFSTSGQHKESLSEKMGLDIIWLVLCFRVLLIKSFIYTYIFVNFLDKHNKECMIQKNIK